MANVGGTRVTGLAAGRGGVVVPVGRVVRRGLGAPSGVPERGASPRAVVARGGHARVVSWGGRAVLGGARGRLEGIDGRRDRGRGAVRGGDRRGAGLRDLRALHRDRATLRLQLHANGCLRRVDDFALVPLVHAGGDLDVATDEARISPAHGAAAETTALGRSLGPAVVLVGR